MISGNQMPGTEGRIKINPARDTLLLSLTNWVWDSEDAVTYYIQRMFPSISGSTHIKGLCITSLHPTSLQRLVPGGWIPPRFIGIHGRTQLLLLISFRRKKDTSDELLTRWYSIDWNQEDKLLLGLLFMESLKSYLRMINWDYSCTYLRQNDT